MLPKTQIPNRIWELSAGRRECWRQGVLRFGFTSHYPHSDSIGNKLNHFPQSDFPGPVQLRRGVTEWLWWAPDIQQVSTCHKQTKYWKKKAQATDSLMSLFPSPQSQESLLEYLVCVHPLNPRILVFNFLFQNLWFYLGVWQTMEWASFQRYEGGRSYSSST